MNNEFNKETSGQSPSALDSYPEVPYKHAPPVPDVKITECDRDGTSILEEVLARFP